MKTIEQLNQQSSLIHTAKILGARYESILPYEHALHLPCGITINVCETGEQLAVFGCLDFHKVKAYFTSPRDLARKTQSYVWVISTKWDQQNHPENK
jgi:hypothetical protein